jgi:hypothetical protein
MKKTQPEMENRPIENRRALLEIHAAIRTAGTPRSQLSSRAPVNTTQNIPYNRIRMRKPGFNVKRESFTVSVRFICQPAAKGKSKSVDAFQRFALFASAYLNVFAAGVAPHGRGDDEPAVFACGRHFNEASKSV